MAYLIRLLISLLLLLTTIPASADETVSIKAGYMSLNASGRYAATGGGVAGTPVDVSSTLNLNRSNNVTVEGTLNLGIYGGYRYIGLKIDQSGIFVDARFQGPFVGAFFRF